MTVISFEEALRATEGEDRSLLLGNGFSVAQSEGAFAYKNLLDKSGVDANSPIRKVFSTLATVDFEEVIHALEHAAKVEEAYDDETKKNLFANDAQSVRNALISAIQAVHPKIVFEIPDKELHSCKSFLTHFSSIFTLNYDLLLYWVRLSPNSPSFSDGFGQGKIVDGFRKFSPSGNCSIYSVRNPRISIQYVDASQMDIWGKKLPPATPRTTAGPLKVALPARRASNA
jgi:hypothetical protein